MAAVALSRSELQAIVLRAARGAGLPWGLAEEAAMAVLWLQLAGLEGASELVHYLRDPDAADSDCCPIRLGARLSDRCCLPDGCFSRPELDLPTVRRPLLLVPALARALGAGTADATASLRLRLIRRGVCLAELAAAQPEAAHRIDVRRLRVDRLDDLILAVEPAEAGVPIGSPSIPAPVASAVVAALEHLGRQTLVPASEESRAGAGAGLLDND